MLSVLRCIRSDSVQASAQELIRVLQAFVRVGESFNVDEGKEAFTSPALALTLAALQPAREAAEGRLTLINTIAAREGKLADMFPDPEAFAELRDCRDVRRPASSGLSWSEKPHSASVRFCGNSMKS